jgi:hypothetical protein
VINRVQGLVWGVTADALPIVPGGVITLTVGDAHYCPSHSQASWLLAVGTIEHNECDDEKIAIGRRAGGLDSNGLNVR